MICWYSAMGIVVSALEQMFEELLACHKDYLKAKIVQTCRNTKRSLQKLCKRLCKSSAFAQR